MRYRWVQAQGGVGVWVPSFLSSTLYQGERLTSCPCRLIPRKERRYIGWAPQPVRKFCRTVKCLAPPAIRTPDRPVRNAVATTPTMLRLEIQTASRENVVVCRHSSCDEKETAADRNGENNGQKSHEVECTVCRTELQNGSHDCSKRTFDGSKRSVYIRV
jgi:hypothetical protein